MLSADQTDIPYGFDFVPNGYLVAAPWTPMFADQYLGIDDAQWPVEEEDSFGDFARRVGIPGPLAGVQVATRWPETFAYWERCQAVRPQARLMLVCTRYAAPSVDPSSGRWERLGYDVAEPLGNHSAVRHEIITGRAPQLARWRSRLNGAGLFEDLHDAEEFMRERQSAADSGQRQGIYLAEGFRFVPVLVLRFAGLRDPGAAPAPGETPLR
jgi:hypothetical protein